MNASGKVVNKWCCTWVGCEKWAQSNGLILCRAHFKQNEVLLRYNVDRGAAETLTQLGNDLNAAPAENDQPMDGPPFFPGHTRRRRRRRVVQNEALEEDEQVGAIVEENEVEGNEQAGSHSPTSPSPLPPSSVPPSSTPMTTTAEAVAATAAHEGGANPMGVPQDLGVLRVHEGESDQRFPERDEERMREEITRISEELRLRDERINALEDRIAELEGWRTIVD